MFNLLSSEIVEQGIIPTKYTMYNPNKIGISSPLNWSDAPRGTKSFTLALVDPDVPLEEEWFPYPIKVGDLPRDLFIHWIVYDIPLSAMVSVKVQAPVEACPLGQKS